MAECSTCHTYVSLDSLVNRYNSLQSPKECKDCLIKRFDGGFYESLLPNSKVDTTITQKSLLTRLVTWCFG